MEREATSERENLTDQQIFMFIFTSGVSTAKEVTDISGRGVGMDVVKREVENFVVKSVWRLPRQARALLWIKLPLTTSIIEGLVVRFKRKSLCYTHSGCTPDADSKKFNCMTFRIESECLILAGEVIPIMRLHEFFDVEADVMIPEEAIIVVVKYGEKKYGLMLMNYCIGSKLWLRILEKPLSICLELLGELFWVMGESG